MEIIEQSGSARTTFLACHMRAGRETRSEHTVAGEVILGNQILQYSMSWFSTTWKDCHGRRIARIAWSPTKILAIWVCVLLHVLANAVTVKQDYRFGS